MPTIKTRKKTGFIMLAVHWTLIFCTLGLWYPIYASRRRSRVTITHIPDGYIPHPHMPPGHYQPQQQPPYGQQPPQWAPPQR